MRLLITTILVLFFGIGAMAQQKTVTGRVFNKTTGTPLAGVTVQSNNRAALTDTSGRFAIQAATGETLTLSYIGMNTLSIKVTDAADMPDIMMEEGNTSLNQVVVVGYTSQRKQDVTGAVAVVEMAPAVKNNSSGNAMQALQGRVAGLYIEKDGSPNGSNGRILIRGANTLGNNDPLYIIDGIPTTRPEVFQNMDPTTIASVQVLKDASAESIYGARASNGVIIVTTRNGGNTDGKVKFQFNNSISAQSEKSMRFEMLNAVDRGRALWQASVNDRQDPTAGYGEIYQFDWNGNYNNPVLNSRNGAAFCRRRPQYTGRQYRLAGCDV